MGGLPKDMKFKLVEPLNVLFKDEVRVLGENFPEHKIELKKNEEILLSAPTKEWQ